jgi:hypothetical protein
VVLQRVDVGVGVSEVMDGGGKSINGKAMLGDVMSVHDPTYDKDQFGETLQFTVQRTLSPHGPYLMKTSANSCYTCDTLHAMPAFRNSLRQIISLSVRHS